ncbi:MAG TPA: hypothetical protein PLD77_03270 [Candidatus Dojkabacteria bacterium]|jgi:hypothetical protein|nr:hypothetical protein [Candidatus Dojkabacteria bacterium]HOV30062.1 hypothetical protein [Candidatus Dojkabacteria bacterium]HQA87788.1 hypothetical protein [Candidatus Dojkabacteria bacterium]
MKEYINKILGEGIMKNNNVQMEDIIVLINQYFKMLDKKISENDKEISLILKEVKKIKSRKNMDNNFNPDEIKIVSYLDS